QILSRLGGFPAPKLLEYGEHEGRKYLAMEWCAGAPADVAARELRNRADGGRAELLALCVRILDAYVLLHERGVVHADVHPGNILVSADGGVRLIDFGLATMQATCDTPGNTRRGGIAEFQEPELASARLNRKRSPSATAEGEQYSLAALVYRLMTGVPYLRFSIERDEMLRQIAE